jgi:hypothetical protein
MNALHMHAFLSQESTPTEQTLAYKHKCVSRTRSPVTRAEFPFNSAGDIYQAIEMFGFMTAQADLEDKTQDTVPTSISWVSGVSRANGQTDGQTDR